MLRYDKQDYLFILEVRSKFKDFADIKIKIITHLKWLKSIRYLSGNTN